MNYRGVLVMLLAVLVSLDGRAADAWKDKPYSEWSMADTTKILTNSPWVKNARVAAPWIKGEPRSLFPMLGGCGGRMDSAEEMPSTPDLGPSIQSMVFYRVSWIQSRTYREAKVRRGVLCGEMEEEDVESYLEQDPSEAYVLHIEAPDMTPFEGLDEPAIQQNTLLIGKKSGLKTAPSQVKLLKAGSRIYGVVISFPKVTADAVPVAAAGETELAFSYKFGKGEIKVKFNPEKMARSGATDL